MVPVATEQPEQLCLLRPRRLEQFRPFQNFHVTSSAARRATRKRDRRQMLIADVDELAAVWCLDPLQAPDRVGQKF
jgi:hypothetical protein